jgi:uncharacterized membrane protein required for colicin V production
MAFASQLYPIDIAVLAILLFGCIQGYIRGLSGELARLIAVVIAFFSAIRFYRPIAARIAEGTRAETEIAQVLAFVATMLAAIVVLLIVRLILKRVIQVVVNEQFDHIAGMFAGVIRTALFSAAILVAMLLWPHEGLNTTVREKSNVGAFLVRVLPHVEALIGAAAEKLPSTLPPNKETETTAPKEENQDATRPPVQPAL